MFSGNLTAVRVFEAKNSFLGNNSKPISNYELGLQVVKILEAAQTSIKNNGEVVLI